MGPAETVTHGFFSFGPAARSAALELATLDLRHARLDTGKALASTMSIPAFNIDGVIPPFVGPHGPGGHRQEMTPYEATPVDVVTALSGSSGRREILNGWLAHRAALRSLGIDAGFQWLDGSFVEDKDPQDLDIVTFFRRPATAVTPVLLLELVRQHPTVFSRANIKDTFRLDAMFVDMDATPEAVVDNTRYWLGLFSHRRLDSMWKGMLKVSLENSGDDATASGFLAAVTPGPTPLSTP